MNFNIDRNKELTGFFILVLFSGAFLSADAFEGLKVYDEGVTVYGALQVLEGYMPYRDFWTVYMPGHFYLYALVFKLFGASLAVERTTSVVLMMGIGIFSYLIARKILPAIPALLVFFFSTVWLSTFNFFGYIIYPTLLCSCISLWFFLRYLQNEKAVNLWWAGTFIGCTALFRHDFGTYLIVVEGLVLGLYLWNTKVYLTPAAKRTFIFRSLLPLLAGTALVFLPVAAYFLLTVPFEELYASLITFPLDVYADYRKLPFPLPFQTYGQFQETTENPAVKPYLDDLLERVYFYFPMAVYALLAVQLWLLYQKNKHDLSTQRFWFSVTILLLGLLFFSKSFIRSVYLHLMPTYVLAILVFFLVLVNIPKTMPSRGWRRMAYVFLLGLSVPALIRPLWGESMRLKTHSNTVSMTAQRAEGIAWDVRGNEYNSALQYIQSHVPEGEKIFVGSVRHDRVFVNDVMFYFLAERMSATKYAELHPGIVTTREVQEEIVQEITEAHVKYIVLAEETRIETENKSGESSGVQLLDNFIRQHYQPEKTFGPYSIWVRKEAVSVYGVP